MTQQQALLNSKIYEIWRFANTDLGFTEWVNMVYSEVYVEYSKVKINVYA